MGRQPGFTYTRFPVEDALENVGAAHNLMGDRWKEVNQPKIASAHKRLARQYWELAETLREETKKAA